MDSRGEESQDNFVNRLYAIDNDFGHLVVGLPVGVSLTSILVYVPRGLSGRGRTGKTVLYLSAGSRGAFRRCRNTLCYRMGVPSQSGDLLRDVI
ncbi:hypothetical protein NEOLEDRAFT_1126717 [Neolentinus lepideus HHB14362 ss-1]|uniref:Uncharacterized protein n=1 Tax=Neolentinus lepideus HHB14362 ss-1 TaxID=1314782 RepID=A0A165VPU7_9AGAM|nr:hypothetical protein NEOLEDRAFT_1126717 [Neolentinus lepideus HHB14362 ss-1]